MANSAQSGSQSVASAQGGGQSSGQRELLVSVGSPIDFYCNFAASSSGERVKWSRDRGPLPPTALIQRTLPTQSKLSLVNVQPSDAGRYICEVSSASGVRYVYFFLRVERKSPLYSRPTSQFG